ncbi:efflux RND transporter periplasmic adaptor subunit [Microvirga sp. STS02]|uniref:efflux RND transporter periplasmic adaptor subunit n=1 Tax=Hymenobacter negativus TaxID=2795026 RepID=UPI0018DCF28F|nr:MULTISPECIES: efflux RND transporter periplasmic adaptor subunit [Bacteria]MBH8567704.1 efflux RND transporter periplasmic adaptor subunit [Hymenobacter negativus]MBR7207438.1 efflux RND transporter periplasmic adaptor subunit [Microvirga sp. STS02]
MPLETNTAAPPKTWDTTTTTPLQAPVPESAPRPAPSGKRGWLGWLIAALIIGGMAWAKVKYFPSPTAGEKGGKGGAAGAKGGGKGGAGGPGAKVPVQVYIVAATRLSDQVAATGSIIADEAVTIQSEISGKITSLNIQEGKPVRKGQLLFTINAADVQAQLQKQEYNIKLYQDQEKRQRTLLAKEYISRQEYEQSNNALLTAQADLAALRVTLSKAYVRAPFDGILGLRNTSVGAYVSPGTAITTLSRVQPVKVDFNVPSRFAQSVRVGDPVLVTDEATTKKIEAKVYAINPQIDPVSRTLPVRAVYANKNMELRPGGFVKVNLELGETAEALQIPTEAVVPVASGYTVFTVKNGKAVIQPVNIGVRSDKLIQITKGLTVGDTIIRTGILQVKAGDRVAIQ